jgi:hypothetical protein
MHDSDFNLTDTVHVCNIKLTTPLTRSASAIVSTGMGESPLGSDAITLACTWFYTSTLPSSGYKRVGCRDTAVPLSSCHVVIWLT